LGQFVLDAAEDGLVHNLNATTCSAAIYSTTTVTSTT
jgi:hypothetical protein